MDIFLSSIFFFFLPLCDIARYRLKYCLKEAFNPKQPTNLPAVAWLWPPFYSTVFTNSKMLSRSFSGKSLGVHYVLLTSTPKLTPGTKPEAVKIKYMMQMFAAKDRITTFTRRRVKYTFHKCFPAKKWTR